jgi:hypothetical protein
MAKTRAVAALLLTNLLLASAAPPADAAGDRLDVKVGLWEMTSTLSFGGTPPLPKEVLEKMTPEQQDRMKADWRAQAAQQREPDVSRECITREDLDKPFQSGNEDDCTQTVVRTTRTTQEIRLVCTGEIKGSGVFRVNTPTPETMTGELDLKAGEGNAVFTIKGTIEGRWLGPECGEEDDDGDDIYDEEDEETAQQ